MNTPFAASELACRAGLAAIDDDEHVERTVETARNSRAYMRDHIDSHVWESEGNFALVAVGDASAVAEEMQARGVIVRDCTSFGLPGCIRITCGTDEETERAVETVNAVLADLEIEVDAELATDGGGVPAATDSEVPDA